KAQVEARTGPALLALDFPGPALVRVDGGAWHAHESNTIYGPRWSAVPVALGTGRHEIEVRLGTYGGGAELRLFLLPASAADAAAPAPPSGVAPAVVEAVRALGDAFAADTAGEVDRALSLATALVKQRKFALGLASAAAILRRD